MSEQDSAAPTATTSSAGDQRSPVWSLSRALAQVLGLGTRLSMALLLLGLTVALIRGGHTGGDLKPEALLNALQRGQGQGVVATGLALLIATPLAREVTALVLFLRQGEQSFAIIGAVVLVLVTLSVFIGAH